MSWNNFASALLLSFRPEEVHGAAAGLSIYLFDFSILLGKRFRAR